MRIAALVCAAMATVSALAWFHAHSAEAARTALARQLQPPPPYAAIRIVAVIPARELDYQCGWAQQGAEELTFVRQEGDPSTPRLYRAHERMRVPSSSADKGHWSARRDEVALTTCRRELAGRRFEAALKGGIRAPEADIALVMVGGHYLAIPSGNVFGKVRRSEGYQQLRSISLRGVTPAWSERDWKETEDVGFGRELTATLSAPPVGAALAFERRLSAAEQEAEILSSGASSPGESHRHVRWTRGPKLGAAEADIYLDKGRQRLTVCSRLTDPRLNASCTATIQQGDFLIDLTFGAPYAERRNEIIDTLVHKLEAWERT